MSVLIQGMDMPKGCGVCPLFDDECFGSYKCKRAKGWGDEENRAYDCPLREIPTPHGRLIDADALSKKDINLANFPYNFIRVAPTIIDAEE